MAPCADFLPATVYESVTGARAEIGSIQDTSECRKRYIYKLLLMHCVLLRAPEQISCSIPIMCS